MEIGRAQRVDAAIIGIGAAVIVDVDAGEKVGRARLGDDCVRHGVPGGLAAGPDAVEIGLAGQHPQARPGGFDIADEDHQAARRRRVGIAAREFAQHEEARRLVAVKQHAQEQRPRPLSGDADQRRSGENLSDIARADRGELRRQPVGPVESDASGRAHSGQR